MSKDGSKKIVVTGCLAQRYANDLANELPEADVIVGFENYGNLPKTVGGCSGGGGAGLLIPQQARVQVGGASPPFRAEVKRLRITPKHTAYLRVAEGCDHKCTFCAFRVSEDVSAQAVGLDHRRGQGAGGFGRARAQLDRGGYESVGDRHASERWSRVGGVVVRARRG